jgi:hypothetical protein
MNQHEVLANIRRAYRYVVAYERRVLDTIDVFDEALRARSFERASPHRTPLHTSFPKKDYAPEHWTWDNVPNYACRYQWRSGEANTAGSCWVLLDHVADTSFEQRRLTVPGEPDPLDSLEPVEATRSILRALVVSFAAPLDPKVYAAWWGTLLTRHFRLSMAELLVSEPTAQPERIDAPPLTLVRHCVDLAELTDPESLRLRFLDPLLSAIPVS